jgi:hypothetical protein
MEDCESRSLERKDAGADTVVRPYIRPFCFLFEVPANRMAMHNGLMVPMMARSVIAFEQKVPMNQHNGGGVRQGGRNTHGNMLERQQQYVLAITGPVRAAPLVEEQRSIILNVAVIGCFVETRSTPKA